MVDVNQLWDVDVAIEYMKNLADLKIWYVALACNFTGGITS